MKREKKWLHIMHDSELNKTLHIRSCRDHVVTDLIKTCIPVTDLIRDKLTSLTLRRNAIAPEMDVITTLTT